MHWHAAIPLVDGVHLEQVHSDMGIVNEQLSSVVAMEHLVGRNVEMAIGL